MSSAHPEEGHGSSLPALRRRRSSQNYGRRCVRHITSGTVTSLLDNHYHTVGWLEIGADLPKMMQRIHAVAKLVNDILPQRHPDF